MIEHIEVIVKETPDVLMMANQFIPKRIKEVKATYDEMVKENYPLEYLNIDYNIGEIEKNVASRPRIPTTRPTLPFPR